MDSYFKMQQPTRTYPPPSFHAHQQQANLQRTLFSGAVFQHPYQLQPKPNGSSQVAVPHYPVHPDVKLKKLPFYEISAELIKPSSLIPQGSQRQQDNTFVFHLTPQQATLIGMSRDMRPGSKVEYAVQVQLRFCLLETTTEQDDWFPPGLMVKVNNKICQLPNPIPTNKPGAEPKRPPRPINITPLIKISPTVGNSIHIQWSADYGRGYVMAVYLVHKKSSEDLLNRLKAKGIRGSDYTRGMIKDKLNEEADCEIATTSLRVSLICPLGKMRMATPCRASTCQHLQCFDASLYLQMNERKPTWLCPVCDRPAIYDKLVIDGYFQDVLTSERLTDDANEIQLHSDGSWSLLVVNGEPTPDQDEERTVQSDSEPRYEIDVDADLAAQMMITTDEATLFFFEQEGDFEQVKKKKKEEVIDLTLSESEEEEEEQSIPAKRAILDMDPVQQLFNFAECKSLVSGDRTSSFLTSGQRSPSLIILDGDSPPPAPSPLLVTATTASMATPTSTATAAAAAAAAVAAQAKAKAKATAAATALAAAKAMVATAMATATLAPTPTLTPTLTQTLTQTLAPTLAPALTPNLTPSSAPALASTLAISSQAQRMPPPPYNAVVSYIQQPCHFLDLDTNTSYRRY